MNEELQEYESVMREHTLYIWKEQRENHIQLLRAYGTAAKIRIPEQIAGKKVTEIGAYCFSKRRPFQTDVWYTEYTDGVEQTAFYREDQTTISPDLQEISERYVEEVLLPETVEKIGSFAFYNCNKLKSLSFGKKLREIGSDAFMNCLKLHTLFLHAGLADTTGLKQVLAQVKWDVEVTFQTVAGEPELVLLYPEYYEGYDEIGPAHIFELNLTGEGFRARQCFSDGKIELALYDEIFPQACVDESERTLLRMAWDRLLYPGTLGSPAKERYEAYVKEHALKLTERLIHERKLSELERLFTHKYINRTQASEAVALASDSEWAEGVASLMKWSRALEPNHQTVSARNRYTF